MLLYKENWISHWLFVNALSEISISSLTALRLASPSAGKPDGSVEQVGLPTLSAPHLAGRVGLVGLGRPRHGCVWNLRSAVLIAISCPNLGPVSPDKNVKGSKCAWRHTASELLRTFSPQGHRDWTAHNPVRLLATPHVGPGWANRVRAGTLIIGRRKTERPQERMEVGYLLLGVVSIELSFDKLYPPLPLVPALTPLSCQNVST